MEKSETIGKLAEALAKAQGSIEGAKKDQSNPYFKSRYADLSSVWDACRKPLSDNGLAIVQTTFGADPDTVTVETLLTHASGEWIKSCLSMRPTKADPQGIGSCLTYARRYSLAAMVGVAPEDDDGNAASQKPFESKAPVAQKYEMHPNEPKDVPESKGEQSLDEVTAIADLKKDLSDMMGKWGIKTKAEKLAFFEHIKRGRPESVDMLLDFKTNFMQYKGEFLKEAV
jgi:hypothetical protein